MYVNGTYYRICPLYSCFMNNLLGTNNAWIVCCILSLKEIVFCLIMCWKTIKYDMVDNDIDNMVILLDNTVSKQNDMVDIYHKLQYDFLKNIL